MGVLLFGGPTGQESSIAVLIGRGQVVADGAIRLNNAVCVGVGSVVATGADVTVTDIWSGCTSPPATVWTEIGVP